MASPPALNDPIVSTWDRAFSHRSDASILIGGADGEQGTVALSGKLASVRVIVEEFGLAFKNANGDEPEHFGDAEGRCGDSKLKPQVLKIRSEIYE